jgi:hypothetical protein
MLGRSENKPNWLKNNPVLQTSRIFRGVLGYRVVSKLSESQNTSISLTDQDWKILESVLEGESGPSESLQADVQWFKKHFS